MTWINKNKICIVDGCDDYVTSLDLCPACYQRLRYWHKRSMKDKVKRMKQLHRCEASLSMQLGNVRTIRGAVRRKTG